MIQSQSIVLVLAVLIAFVNAHSFKFTHLSGPKICSFASRSIDVHVESDNPEFTTPFILFHHIDVLTSNIPDFVHFNGGNLQKCSDLQNNNTCQSSEGFFVQFDQDVIYGHDEVINAFFNQDITRVHYEVANKGLYCLYIDTTQPYNGQITFTTSRNRYLSRDIEIRLSFSLFGGILYFILFGVGCAISISDIALKIKFLVFLKFLLDGFIYLLIRTYFIKGFYVFRLILIKDVITNFCIKPTLLFQVFGASRGYGEIETKNWFNSQTVWTSFLTGAIGLLDFKKDRIQFHEPIDISFHDFYLGPKRLCLSIITIVFHILAYLTMVIQAYKLQKQIDLSRSFRSTLLGFALLPISYLLACGLHHFEYPNFSQFSAYEQSYNSYEQRSTSLLERTFLFYISFCLFFGTDPLI